VYARIRLSLFNLGGLVRWAAAALGDSGCRLRMWHWWQGWDMNEIAEASVPPLMDLTSDSELRKSGGQVVVEVWIPGGGSVNGLSTRKPAHGL
jgi:hypothetical protein